MKVIFWISAIIIFWGMIGYPLSIFVINRIVKHKEILKNITYQPKVTLLIVAHNEEKVIKNKLVNVINVDYPQENLEIIVSSDNSTDNTEQIVEKFIKDNILYNIKLYKVKERKGKTNAQNEAVRIATGDVLVMTDANAMLDKMSIKELVSSFSQEDIAYVTGRLIYTNGEEWTSVSESTYWDLDLSLREIESNIQTITAGNGALYACMRKDYKEFDAIECHDSSMPLYYALNNKRAIYNPEAKAYEKAGETQGDEFKRKVRMSRKILKGILPNIKILNICRYKWFTYFYLGHRTARYTLGIAHVFLYVANSVILADGWIYKIGFIGQTIFYLGALSKMIFNIDNKFLNMMYYYCLTIVAQLKGIYNQLTGRSKPFWEKAESTR